MKNEKTTRSYPLYWPEGWPRTESNKIKRAQFKDRSVFTARDVFRQVQKAYEQATGRK